tara:strand:+ start:11513 stop:12520 length:1008 start_codon:yes stop_codon:yes gene_type:complete
MKKENPTDKPLKIEFRADGRGAEVELKKADANKYLGYPSTYAQCMSHAEYLTDTAGMSSVKAAGACAAFLEKMKEDELEHQEGNLKKGYPALGIPPMANSQPGGQPGTVITTPQTTLSSSDCPCEEEANAAIAEEKKQKADLVPFQRGTDFLKYTPEEQKQIEENLKHSHLGKRYWLDPKVDGKPYYDTEAAEKDYSSYLKADIGQLAAKTKKQWEKIDKKELDRDSKKEKVEHEKDAVKDDQSKINKLKKGKPSVKKSVEVHDLKKDQEFDKEDKIKYSKAGKPWEKTDEDELKKDDKKEKKEHEKDAVKDDKKQIKDLKKDIKEDKKAEKKDK